jgi:uncharacterized damage-inducible protein DinB
MFHTIDEFLYVWSQEVEATQKILKHLTNQSLTHPFPNDIRTSGRLAWHIVTTISEMMERTGLKVAGPHHDDPIPPTARDIFAAYNDAALSLIDQMREHWNDASLEVEDDMYGQRWKRRMTLQALVLHQVHHRGQLTVTMRLAGLDVPGVYGPAHHEWKRMGMEAPLV